MLTNSTIKRMRTHYVGIAFALLISIIAIKSNAQIVAAYGPLNSKGEDYAASFRTVAHGDEIWLTTSNMLHGVRSRKLVRGKFLNGQFGDLTDAPQPINQPTNTRDVQFDGCPTFTNCDTSYMVFVSNRLVDGKDYNNDLYEARFSNGEWRVSRIDALSTTAWDDTPSLNADGSVLYFASDRLAPGSGHSDIFMSRRDANGKWGAPVRVEGIASNPAIFSTQCPFLASDGYLYYASNESESRDYNIWRVRLDGVTMLPYGKPIALAVPGVNESGSDEGHPTFSPGGNYFLFSSNRDTAGRKTKDLDLYAVRIKMAAADTINVRVLLRTHTFNEYRHAFDDITLPVSTTVHYRDLNGALNSSIASDQQGFATIILPRTVPELYQDKRARAIAMEAEPKAPNYIASKDTILFDQNLSHQISYTLYLWDTAVLYSSECTQDFPVTNVQFFITGYWCPTTLRYQDYTPCRSIFPTPQCEVVEAKKPELPCEANDLYTYTLHYVAPTVEVNRQPGLCVDMGEAKAKRDEFAVKVDSAVGKFVENMRAALLAPCVERAIKQDSQIIVEVYGWTDPRELDNACLYTGETIDFTNNFIHLDDIQNKHYIRDNKIVHGLRFRESGAGGNQLLSDLRAYYTSVLLDSVWQRYIPEYRDIRNRGLLRVTAVGKAISQKDLPFEQRRSVNVRVITPIDPNQVRHQLQTAPGGKLVLSGAGCLVTEQ